MFRLTRTNQLLERIDRAIAAEAAKAWAAWRSGSVDALASFLWTQSIAAVYAVEDFAARLRQLERYGNACAVCGCDLKYDRGDGRVSVCWRCPKRLGPTEQQIQGVSQ